MKKPLCPVPFTNAYFLPDGKYRECCQFNPNIGKQREDFITWWKGPEMETLRQQMLDGEFPDTCMPCKRQEDLGEQSLRQSYIESNTKCDVNARLPNWYQIGFSNTCNMGCWICYEGFSSVIEEEKRRLNILPLDYVNVDDKFQTQWQDLKERVLESYEEHDVITINLLGGEPSVNNDCIQFLEELVELGLNRRTKIELLTNCYKPKPRFLELIHKHNWLQVVVVASIDAVGEANDWIRYGSKWEDVVKNLNTYKAISHYCKIETIVSILNLRHLPKLLEFARSQSVDISTLPLSEPWYLDIANWDKSPELLADEGDFRGTAMQGFYDSIGSTAREGTCDRLRSYILSMKRPTDIRHFDPALHEVINV